MALLQSSPKCKKTKIKGAISRLPELQRILFWELTAAAGCVCLETSILVYKYNITNILVTITFFLFPSYVWLYFRLNSLVNMLN